jgi:hypothetical protein
MIMHFLLKSRKGIFPLLASLTIAFSSASLPTKNFEAQNDFYTKYIATYYPKAYVIRERYFANMTPDEIVKSLKTVIDVIAERTWFYVSNNPHTFACGQYWEFFIDQLNILHEFLYKAKVDPATQKVFIPYEDESLYYSQLLSDSFEMIDDGTVAFLEYIDEPWHKSIIYEFYVLFFDFLIKMFNEGILSNDRLKTITYLSELEYITELLEGSDYEATYKEHLATCHQLADVLRQRRELN